MSVSALPLYKLHDIPESLRQLANRIEHGEIEAVNCVVCIVQENGEPTYTAFGSDPFTRMTAMGLLEGVKFMLMNPEAG